MILVDTSIWVEHLRTGTGHRALATLLEHGRGLTHPWVIGELALGHLSQRVQVITLMTGLPQAPVATPAEVLTLIERHQLHGSGIGYVDAQLLAATLMAGDAALWTSDKRLAAAASRVGCAVDPAVPP